MSSGDQPYVLYVDDERGNRAVFKHSFAGMFPVETVASGTEALELMKTMPVAVLVTDQRMPDMTGNELLRTVKELYPSAIRIIISAYSDFEPLYQAMNEGLVARYLVKPWARQELEQMLLWAYEAFRAGQEHGAIQLRLLQTERAATLGNLAAAVFHDIRQPLAAISHSIDAMDMFSESVGALREVVARHKSELSPRDAENLGQLAGDLRDIVKDMRTSCDLVLSATRVIQEWQRPAASGQRPAVDPMPAIEFVTSVCSSRAREAGARVTYDGPASLPKVAIRHAELMQVMINLVLNACDALAGKPGRNKHITIHGAESGEFVSFAVADDGPGMSPDVLNKVGTPFFTTREQGTGLGVAQCKRMVEQTGGVLSIDSKVGVGTTVAFTIPRAG